MGLLKKLFGGKDGSERKETTSELKSKKKSPSSKSSFLQEPIDVAQILDYNPEISEINNLLNSSVKFYNNNNYKDSVRCINTALAMNPSFSEAIALHRNRAVALGSLLGFGTSKPQQKDFDHCYATEHVTRDAEAIIGLYATNESMIVESFERGHADFLKDCFNMAMSSYYFVGMSNMAYEENGSCYVYEDQLDRVWDIGFVPDPKDALQVNGTIYPQHKLVK